MLSFLSSFKHINSTITVPGQTSSTMLNKGGISGDPYYAPHFRGNAFKVSPLKLIVFGGLPV